jgi:hypothetical protein
VKSGYRFITSSLALLGLLVVFAPVQVQAAEEKVFAGTIEINSTQMAFIISGQSGGGVLEFQGQEYKFNIGGLGIGGIGIAKLNAVGAVYNMDDISKFSGTYIQARAGATLGTGKSSLSLSNKNGVIIDLKSSNKGAALQLGVDGMILTLK